MGQVSLLAAGHGSGQACRRRLSQLLGLGGLLACCAVPGASCLKPFLDDSPAAWDLPSREIRAVRPGLTSRALSRFTHRSHVSRRLLLAEPLLAELAKRGSLISLSSIWPCLRCRRCRRGLEPLEQTAGFAVAELQPVITVTVLPPLPALGAARTRCWDRAGRTGA